MSVKISCGPIIGTVTDTTARILLEVEESSKIDMILTSSENIVHNKVLLLPAKFPTIFFFENLNMNTLYKISFTQKVTYLNEDLSKLSSKFRTLNKSKSICKFALISCNSIKQELKTDKKYSLWKYLSDHIDEYDYIFHCGDQVYLDDGDWVGKKNNPYSRVKDLLNSVEPENFIYHETTIRNIIREEYLKTFNYEFIANVHRNAPNFMILDDHEIYDDLGFKVFNDDKISKINEFYENIARWYYYAYQKQLWKDINFKDFSNIKTEYHYTELYDIGLFFIDWRGCRTWCKDERDELKLGSEQWKDLENCFGKGGKFRKENINTSIIFTTTPLVLLSDNIVTNFFKNFENDVYEQWSISAPLEQERLLKLGLDYKNETGKDFLFASGDIHMSGHTEIRYDEKYLIKQFITSGIMQECPTPLQTKFAEIGFNYEASLKDGKICYKHYDIDSDNNYGIITIDKNNIISCSWVKSRQSENILPYETNKVIFNHVHRHECGCCNII